jgi:tetratricopeptide (TPR) repeat protein
MGVVYKAQQESLGRFVAVKMILAGAHASADQRLRFQTEAAALARLQHPNIVQVFESGEHQGVPYFAIEFVEGVSLEQRLAGTPLPPQEAAQLTAVLAAAVQAAHTRGIIHRDLKPGNILLAGGTETPVSQCTPKITDFGLAKHLGQEGPHTASGALLGTPSYMAPEQAAGQTKVVGPSTDVYALGAVLYEMLTGRPPFKGATPFDTIDQVIHQEPVAPSRLQPKVPRDLETICLKCLQKDPAKRYLTAAALVDDLHCSLTGKPIQARPVGNAERLWRWCRRNPLVAASAATAILALVIGTVVAWAYALEANTARIEAEKETEKARQAELEAVTARLAEKNAHDAKREMDQIVRMVSQIHIGEFDDPLGIAGAANPLPPRVGETRKVHENLELAAKLADRDYSSVPKVHAFALEVVANGYRTLGMYPKAELYLKKVHRLRASALPENPLLLGDSHFNLGVLYQEWGHFDQADTHFKLAHRVWQANKLRASDQRVTKTLFHQAWLLVQIEEFPQAEKLFREVISRLQQRGVTEEDREFIVARFGMIGMLMEQARVADFGKEIRPHLQAVLKNMNNPHLDRGLPLFVSAVEKHLKAEFTRQLLAKSEDAAKDMEEAIRCLHAAIGPNQYEGYLMWVRADMLAAGGKVQEAETAYRESIQRIKETLGFEHHPVWQVLNSYGRFLHKQGRGKEIDPLYDKFITTQEERWPAPHFYFGHARTHYAELLQFRGEYARQEKMAREALAIYEKTFSPQRPTYRRCVDLLRDALRKQGKPTEEVKG